MVSPKKLHATVNCCCKLLGADANGVVTGAVGIGTGALVNSRVGTVVGSTVGASVDTEGDTDGVSVGVLVIGRFVGIVVLFGDVMFVVGAVVVVVFGTVDTDGGTLLDVVVDDVSSPPLQFPVPQ